MDRGIKIMVAGPRGPSVIDGLAALFDFSGAIRGGNVSIHGFLDDARALRGDGQAISGDFKVVVKRMSNEQQELSERNPAEKR